MVAAIPIVSCQSCCCSCSHSSYYGTITDLVRIKQCLCLILFDVPAQGMTVKQKKRARYWRGGARRGEESAREKKRTRFEIRMWVIIEEGKKNTRAIITFVREEGRDKITTGWDSNHETKKCTTIALFSYFFGSERLNNNQPIDSKEDFSTLLVLLLF